MGIHVIITNYKYARYNILGVICQDDGKYKTKQQQQTIRILGVYNTLGLGSTASRVRRGPSGIDWNPNPGEPESILSLRLSPALYLSLSLSLSRSLSSPLTLSRPSPLSTLSFRSLPCSRPSDRYTTATPPARVDPPLKLSTHHRSGINIYIGIHITCYCRRLLLFRGAHTHAHCTQHTHIRVHFTRARAGYK